MQRLQMNLLLQGEQLQLSVKSERPIDRRNDIFIAQKNYTIGHQQSFRKL